MGQAIPFDVDRISPFGVIVVDTQDYNNVVRLTYKGTVVGSVGAHDGDGFALHVALPVSETVDRVIKRVFEIINQHHLHVVRFLAEEKQRQRADPEIIAEARARQREADLLALEEIAAEEAARREDSEAERRRCCGFDLVADPDDEVKLEGFTFADIEAAAEFSADDDALKIMVWNYDARPRTFSVSTRSEYQWMFAQENDTVSTLQGDTEFLPDIQKITPILRKIVDRNLRIQDPDRLKILLSTLDDPQYSIEMFSLSDDPLPEAESKIRVSDEVSFYIKDSNIKLKIEDIDVAHWTIAKNEIRLDRVVFPRICKVLDREDFGTPDVLSTIGSLWLSQVMPASRLEGFRFIDVDDVERDALSIDVGYNL